MRVFLLPVGAFLLLLRLGCLVSETLLRLLVVLPGLLVHAVPLLFQVDPFPLVFVATTSRRSTDMGAGDPQTP